MFGILMSPTTVNGAWSLPFSSPSKAASFIGWVRATTTPDESPVSMTSPQAISPKMLPTNMLLLANRTSRLRSRYHALMPTTTTAPVSHPLMTVCRNLVTATGENATSRKAPTEFISLRTVSGLNVAPTGCCIHALATSIHHADIVAPSVVSHVEARWKPRLTLSQPKYITAMNVLSIKKATMPSMASGAPKMSPTYQE